MGLETSGKFKGKVYKYFLIDIFFFYNNQENKFLTKKKRQNKLNYERNNVF